MSYPPGPTSNSLVTMRRWATKPTELLRECAAAYGDAFTLKLPGVGRIVMLHSPAEVARVFAGNPNELLAGEFNVVIKPLLGSSSVLILDRAPHDRQRRLLMPPFHGERMRAYSDVMREASLRAIKSWPTGTAFPLHPSMQQITLEVILQTVFGIDGTSREGQHLGGVLSRLLDSIARPIFLLPGLLGVNAFEKLPFLKMSKLKAEADRTILAEIARRRAGAKGAEGGEDVLSLLLTAKDDQGQGMTDAELRDEMMTLLVAGHETTATGLAWTFDALLHEPAVLARLVAEVKGGTDLARMPFLDATIKEALRLKPVIPIVGRIASNGWTVGPHELPKGTRIAPCIWLVHRRADIYPDPERFNPERFLGKTPDASEYLPFGGANRRCLGAAFAMHEMKIVLGTILANARLEAAGELEVVRRRSITFSPNLGTRVVLKERAAA